MPIYTCVMIISHVDKMHILVYKSIICVCVRECVSVRGSLRDSTCTNHDTQLEIMKSYPFFYSHKTHP